LILLDTQVLLFDALEPRRLSRRARDALAQGTASGTLACSDISLWEIAMAIARRRIEAGANATGFIEDVLQSRSIQVLPITPEIAVLAQSDQFAHGDPADRIIAATALSRRAPLVSADDRLRRMSGLKVIW
jgi:PIN domain nuclease of toxin-antitoxin system